MVGTGCLFAGLRLWRYVWLYLALGTVVIAAVNWTYYRHKAQAGGSSSSLRRAMGGE